MPSRLLCMAAKSLNIPFELVEVHNMQCDIMAVEEPRSAVGPMAFWNPGIAHQTIWTAKKVTVRTDDGTDVIMTKRGRCLRYIIKRFQTGVVDCGLS